MAKLLKMLWEYMDLTVLPFFETWSAHIFGGWQRVCWCTNEAFNQASPTKEFWENCPQKKGGHIYGKNEGGGKITEMTVLFALSALRLLTGRSWSKPQAVLQWTSPPRPDSVRARASENLASTVEIFHNKTKVRYGKMHWKHACIIEHFGHHKTKYFRIQQWLKIILTVSTPVQSNKE